MTLKQVASTRFLSNPADVEEVQIVASVNSKASNLSLKMEEQIKAQLLRRWLLVIEIPEKDFSLAFMYEKTRNKE